MYRVVSIQGALDPTNIHWDPSQKDHISNRQGRVSRHVLTNIYWTNFSFPIQAYFKLIRKRYYG